MTTATETMPKTKGALATASAEAAFKSLGELCAKDNSKGVMTFLKKSKTEPGKPIWRGLRAIDAAIQADAPRTFAALIQADLAQKGEGLTARLFGGSTPAHRCIRWVDHRGVAHSALRCLDVAIGMDPLLFRRVDENKQSVLALSAAKPDSPQFSVIFSSIARAKDLKVLPPEQAAALMERLAFLCAAGSEDATACMEKLDALEAGGVDWRNLKDDRGQSVLGACVAHGKESVAVAMLAAGASPSSSMYAPELAANGETSNCVQEILSVDRALWKTKPLLARTLLASLDDAALEEEARMFLEASASNRDMFERACEGAFYAEGAPILFECFESVFSDVLIQRWRSIKESKALNKLAEKLKNGREEKS